MTSLHHLGITPLSPLRPQFSISTPLGSNRRLSLVSQSPGSNVPAQQARSGSSLATSRNEAAAASDLGDLGDHPDPDPDPDPNSDADSDDMNDIDSEQSADDDDVTQDSRDVLVERLADLAQRLSQEGNHVLAENLNRMHAQVDEMERMLARQRNTPNARRLSHSSSSVRSSFHEGQPSPSRPASLLLASPASPSWAASHFYGGGSDALLRRASSHSRQSSIGLDSQKENVAPSMQPAPPPAVDARPTDPVSTAKPSGDLSDFVREAEKMCAEMAEVVSSLQARREESDHLHAVFIEREELAAQRILELEARAEELEEAVHEDESELRFLRLQLRSIEAQALAYVPKGADPDLDQSIRNWKADWASLREKWSIRRGSSFGDDDTFSSITSPPR